MIVTSPTVVGVGRGRGVGRHRDRAPAGIDLEAADEAEVALVVAGGQVAVGDVPDRVAGAFLVHEEADEAPAALGFEHEAGAAFLGAPVPAIAGERSGRRECALVGRRRSATRLRGARIAGRLTRSAAGRHDHGDRERAEPAPPCAAQTHLTPVPPGCRPALVHVRSRSAAQSAHDDLPSNSISPQAVQRATATPHLAGSHLAGAGRERQPRPDVRATAPDGPRQTGGSTRLGSWRHGRSDGFRRPSGRPCWT